MARKRKTRKYTKLISNFNETRVNGGRAGGKAGRGKAKARSSKMARAAVQVRWANYRRQKRQQKITTSVGALQ